MDAVMLVSTLQLATIADHLTAERGRSAVPIFSVATFNIKKFDSDGCIGN